MTSTRAFALLMCIFACLPCASISQGKYSLAVLNLRAEHNFLSYSDSRLISSELAQEMSQASLFYTMSQAEMERRLLAAHQDPAAGCPTLDCAFQAGEILKAELVIYGTIRPAGSSITIEAHLVHIGGREVVKSFSDDISSNLQDISTNMRRFAREFLGLPVDQPPNQPDTLSAPVPEMPDHESASQQRREPVTQLLPRLNTTTRKKEPKPQVKPPPPAPKPEVVEPQDTDVHEPEELQTSTNGRLKWTLVGIGALVVGGVSAALLLTPGGDTGTLVGGGTGLPGDPVDDTLPPPPPFP